MISKAELVKMSNSSTGLKSVSKLLDNTLVEETGVEKENESIAEWSTRRLAECCPAQPNPPTGFPLEVVSIYLDFLIQIDIFLHNLKRGNFDYYGSRHDMFVEYDFRLVQIHAETDSSGELIQAAQHLGKILQRPCKDDNFVSETEILGYFLSCLFASILEDSITELRILVECNNELRIIKTMSDMKMLLAKKFGVKLPQVMDELEGIDPKNLNCNEYKIYKLDSDRNYVTEVLTMTYIDLSVNKNFKALKKCINIITALDDYRAELAQEEASNRVTRHDLARQLRQLRNHIKSTIYDSDVTISNLNTEVEDSIFKSEIQSRYIGNWQRARTEQHNQKIYDTEEGHDVQVEYFKRRTEHEQRVHAEAELLTNIMINETLEKVEQWMDKYDKDVEALDLKIQIKKNEYYIAYEKRTGLEQTIQEHDELMKMWINFKDEREKARLYREKMNKSAITVQAWWRGLLVRRQLGPYKVSKKKGKKEKK